MRHGRRIPRLSKPADQRKALLRALTTALLRYGRITTTKARAKAIRAEVDHMITLAKEGSPKLNPTSQVPFSSPPPSCGHPCGYGRWSVSVAPAPANPPDGDDPGNSRCPSAV